MAHSAKADSALWPIAQNELKSLGEIEVIFKMALGNESGNQVGSIHEKKPEVENLVRLSLYETHAGVKAEARSWKVID